MGGGALLFLLIGLLFLGIAVSRMLVIRTFSFKNKKVMVQGKIMMLVGGIGAIALLYWLLVAIF